MPVTVNAGALRHPNGMKPYYYNGYYYVFYLNGGYICYRKSSDGTNWDSEVQINTYYSQAQVMAIDDKVLLTYLVSSSDYVYVKVGTIQSDGTISWGSAQAIGQSAENRAISNYVVKINGTRRFFSKAGPTCRDRLYRSADDGATWTDLSYCTEEGGLYWFAQIFIPYEDSSYPDRVETIYSRPYNYYLRTKERNGSSCSSEDNLGSFRNQHYVNGQAYGILIDNEVHVIYIDGDNNLIHKKATYGGSWSSVGTVKSGINSDAGVTLCYDENSSKLYIFYWEGTSIKYKTWESGVGYSTEQTLVSGEADVNYLTAYPKPLNNKILLVWADGTNVRFETLAIQAYSTETKTYDLDVIIKKLDSTKTYNLDVLIKKLGLAKTYDLDVLIKKLNSIKTYDLDLLIKRLGLTKTYDLDTLLRKLNISKAYDLDVLFKAIKIKSYDLDTLFKKLGLTKAYDLDLILKKLSEKSYDLDTVLKAIETLSYDLDTVLKAVGIKTYDLDTILAKLGVTSTYNLDVRILKIVTAQYLLDVILKKLGQTETYLLDVYLKEEGEANEKEYDLDVIFKKIDAELVYNLDVLFKKEKIKEYIIDVVLHKIVTSTYDLDVTFEGTQCKTYLLDLIILETISLDWVLEEGKIYKTVEAVPPFISQEASYQSDIWTKDIERREIRARVTDAQLDKLLSNINKVFSITYGDSSYTVWLSKCKARFVPHKDRRWLVTLTVYILNTYTSGDGGGSPSCPSGEQIINGGFETGDFTGWEETGNNQEISTFDPHSGTYCVNLYNFGGYVGAIKQELSEPISYDCINSFTAWFAAGASYGDYLKIIITYSDNTTTEWTEFTGADNDWHEINIKSHLDPNKSVKAIEFQMTDDSEDVRIDDISLIGSG